MYLMMSGRARPSRRTDGSSSSRPKAKRQQGESSATANYPRDKKDLSFDSFIVQNAIHEQSLFHEDFGTMDGFL